MMAKITITPEQALKRVEELAQEVEDFKKTNAAEYEKRIKDLMLGYDTMSLAAQKLTNEANALKAKLVKYEAFEKALASLKVEGGSVDPDAMRAMVREELAKTPQGSAEGVQVNESIPNIDLKVSRPWLSVDESTVEGQILVMAMHDKLPKKFGFGDVVKQLQVDYSASPRRTTIQSALDALVGKYKALVRLSENNQWVYSLVGDAASRVKESVTTQAMEAKEA